jgi:hypothetical protein
MGEPAISITHALFARIVVKGLDWWCCFIMYQHVCLNYEHYLGRWQRRYPPPTSTRVSPRGVAISTTSFQDVSNCTWGTPWSAFQLRSLFILAELATPLGFRITRRSGYGVGFKVVRDLNTGAVELRLSTALLEVPLFMSRDKHKHKV